MIDAAALHTSFDALTSALGGEAVHVGCILGSGWSDMTDELTRVASIPFSAIPCLQSSASVAGHTGRLDLIATPGGRALVFHGRRHYYEGLGWNAIAFPVYAAKRLGAAILLLTNASGGIADDLTPGSLLALSDHINAMGTNPLIGQRDPFWGRQFTDQSSVYSPELRAIALDCARESGLALREGVYLATPGPVYETPAEVRWFRSAGADAVGMSTVPEAILGNAAGLRVCAISCIANRAAGLAPAPLCHEEVLDAAKQAKPQLKSFLVETIKRFCAHR